MKSINLISLLNAYKTLPNEIFLSYLKYYDVSVKANEIDDIECLVKELHNKNINDNDKIKITDQFYIGYTIPQISKEFDLLKFGEENIINIELKNINTGEKIREQLVKNKYYLKFLNKEIYNFTFVSSEKTLYYLNYDNNLIKYDLNDLITLLLNQIPVYLEDIDKLFNPSNYLISPFNSTEKFINNEYFLTDQQVNIKKDILKIAQNKEANFICIEGAAGTGKTLLSYDIAKHFISNSKTVYIYHCGKQNSGHSNLINNYSWPIYNIKDINNDNINYCNADLILIDEVQRIYKYQLDLFIKKICKNTLCIFSYDSNQCLSSSEIRNNIPGYIKSTLNPKIFKLTEKVRTNKEIASFIKNLFNLSKKNQTITYNNISIEYFSSIKSLTSYIKILKEQNYTIINYTPSRYTPYPYNRYQDYNSNNAHEVIGQEFDKVVAIIDEHFFYRNDGLLSTHNYLYKPYYHPTKMLFQILTRTRKTLKILILNNKELLLKCLEIINKK